MNAFVYMTNEYSFYKKHASFTTLLVTVNSPNCFISVTSWQHLADVLNIHLQTAVGSCSALILSFFDSLFLSGYQLRTKVFCSANENCLLVTY